MHFRHGRYRSRNSFTRNKSAGSLSWLSFIPFHSLPFTDAHSILFPFMFLHGYNCAPIPTYTYFKTYQIIEKLENCLGPWRSTFCKFLDFHLIQDFSDDRYLRRSRRLRTLGYNQECSEITNFGLFKGRSNISRTLGYFKEFLKTGYEFSIILKRLQIWRDFDGL